MAKRIVIVGGVAAGASAAAKARRMNEDVEIVMLEAGSYISFANCGLPYYVGGEIADRDKLFVVKADVFARRFNVDIRTETTVTSVDRAERVVTVRRSDGKYEKLTYDRLLLATGAESLRPPIRGLDRDNIFMVRSVPDVDAISDFLHQATPPGQAAAESIQRVPLRTVVIGGGYIGLETAEQLLRLEVGVTVVEMADQLMLAMDPEMAQPLQAALETAGAEVILSDAVAEIADEGGRSVVVTQSGRRIPFDLGILAVGVRPNVELAAASGVELGDTGAIKVDALQRTSDPAIYAAGDNSETQHIVLGRPVNIPLAGAANKAGRAAGANMALDLIGAADNDLLRLTLKGVLGTAVVRVGKVVAACTGLNERAARRAGMDYEVIYLPGPNHASYYPGAEMMVLKILFARDTSRLLGAQAVGGEGVDKRIDVIATAIVGGLTIEDLEQLDLCYAPPFGSAKDVAILAGFAGTDVRRGLMPTITPAKLLEELVGQSPPVVLDVRSSKEFTEGHLDGALHIPVDELRDRLEEVPRDQPVAAHCEGGYRSYLAQRILTAKGWRNVRNVTGGFMMIRRQQALRRAGRA